MEIIQIIISGIILILVVVKFFLPQNLKSVTNQVEETIGKRQSENLFQTLAEIGKIQTQIQLHIASQETEFVKLKAQNAEAINIFATEFRKELNQTSTELIGSNNLQIAKLQESNQKSFEQLSLQNQAQLGEMNNQVQARLDQNFAQHLKSFETVSQSVGQVQALAQNMIDSTTSIDKLNQIFGKTAAKSYGNFGEEYLETILQEHLPKTLWNKQVLVPNGRDKIDFTIQMDDKTIGIDSKFPVGAYQQYIETGDAKQFYTSVLKMGTDISQKYNSISDQLLMFLPSDSMYVLVTENLELMTKLQKLCVSPVSPATFFPFIMTMKAYYTKIQISENANQIIDSMRVIQKNIGAFQDEFRKLGEKLNQAQNNYDLASAKLTKVDKEVLKLDCIQETPLL